MYRALYRKWRPQRFEDVVGQRGIVTALRNQIATGRVGHAYLFTGVRGTGRPADLSDAQFQDMALPFSRTLPADTVSEC